MLNDIEAYLSLRRATGFAMINAEYLLKSFAAFAVERVQIYIDAQTAIEWAARGPSVAQRDARVLHVMPGLNCRRPITSAPERGGVHRISTRPLRSIA